MPRDLQHKIQYNRLPCWIDIVKPGVWMYLRRYRLADDLGRYNVTMDDGDQRMWRVPSLRNIEITAPYFHNGAVKSLDEAVRVMAKTQLKQTLTAAQVKDIVAFLATLTGPFPSITLPRLPATPSRSVLMGYDE